MQKPPFASPLHMFVWSFAFTVESGGKWEEILSISRNAIRSHSGIKVLSLASLPPTPLGSSNRPTTTSTLDKEKGISLFPLFLLLEPRNQYLPSPLPFIQRCPLLLNWPGGLELTEIPLLRGGGIGQADEKLIQVAEKRRHRRVSKREEERPKVHRFPFFLFFKSVVVIIFFVVSWYVPSSLPPSFRRSPVAVGLILLFRRTHSSATFFSIGRIKRPLHPPLGERTRLLFGLWPRAPISGADPSQAYISSYCTTTISSCATESMMNYRRLQPQRKEG